MLLPCHRRGHDHGHHQVGDWDRSPYRERRLAHHPAGSLLRPDAHLHPCERRRHRRGAHLARQLSGRRRHRDEGRQASALPGAEFRSATVAECSFPVCWHRGCSPDAEHQDAAFPEWRQRGCYLDAERQGAGCLRHHPLPAIPFPGLLLPLAREPQALRLLEPLRRGEPLARGLALAKEPPSREPSWARLLAWALSPRRPRGRPSTAVPRGVRRWRTVL